MGHLEEKSGRPESGCVQALNSPAQESPANTTGGKKNPEINFLRSGRGTEEGGVNRFLASALNAETAKAGRASETEHEAESQEPGSKVFEREKTRRKGK